mgnify:CR=1 FL=1
MKRDPKRIMGCEELRTREVDGMLRSLNRMSRIARALAERVAELEEAALKGET